MIREIPGELLEDIRADNNITWSDDTTDRNLRNQIGSGMAYLDGKLGEPGDYLSDGLPRTLLFEHVRYARSGAIDAFEVNYLSMILAMQTGRQVQRYAEKNPVSP